MRANSDFMILLVTVGGKCACRNVETGRWIDAKVLEGVAPIAPVLTAGKQRCFFSFRRGPCKNRSRDRREQASPAREPEIVKPNSQTSVGLSGCHLTTPTCSAASGLEFIVADLYRV